MIIAVNFQCVAKQKLCGHGGCTVTSKKTHLKRGSVIFQNGGLHLKAADILSFVCSSKPYENPRMLQRSRHLEKPRCLWSMFNSCLCILQINF